ncbi:hypothetical protein BCO_0900107 (plasmid) [Borrelia coriaceae ATCC 43381]|uniref:Uncharacterized protein n=1 Tax=Borrelia coriaceae ATCC 43381 TaxID=1408429 RepID=W5T2P0_9SPIR|nr:hypothetical protein BCO_0900107 [Borrelia coriaceae ATCC 43381]
MRLAWASMSISKTLEFLEMIVENSIAEVLFPTPPLIDAIVIIFVFFYPFFIIPPGKSLLYKAYTCPSIFRVLLISFYNIQYLFYLLLVKNKSL